MLRKCMLALAAIAIVSSAPVSAETAATASTDPKTTEPAATIVAKAEEDATPSSDAPAASGGPEAAPVTAKAAEPAAEPAKPAPAPEPTLTAAIDLSSQTITVSENGVAKYTWAISSGTRSHPTPRGTFRPQWTAKMWYSRKYDNAPMPHAVFVHNGVAIHATYATGMLGRPASHGCIRLSPTNAKTFYGLVQRHGLSKTKVSIYGNPPWGADPYVASNGSAKKRYAAIQQQQVQQDSGWDWFGLNSQPKYVAKPAYAQPYPMKKRKGGPVYYYAQNGNIYMMKPGSKQLRQVKKYYYSGNGYGY